MPISPSFVQVSEKSGDRREVPLPRRLWGYGWESLHEYIFIFISRT
jgi:hypothetical protein